MRRATWDEVRDFSHGVAQHLVRLAPDQFTAVMSKARRKGKIYIDWVRNTREATAIASYSTRARPGAPVALPLAWDELESLSSPLRESVREVPRRMAMPDPWQHFEASRRPLSRAALDRVKGVISRPLLGSPPGAAAENCAIEPSAGLGDAARAIPDRMARFVLR